MATRTVIAGELRENDAGSRLFYPIARCGPCVSRTPTRPVAAQPRGDAMTSASVRRHQGREVVPAVGDFGEVVLAQPLVALGDHLAAQRVVEQARAVCLEHPQVEAEQALANEVARALAHELAPDTALLMRLQDVERIDLGVQALDR